MSMMYQNEIPFLANLLFDLSLVVMDKSVYRLKKESMPNWKVGLHNITRDTKYR